MAKMTGICAKPTMNPYTCRLLRRLDYALLWMRGRRPFWSSPGALCVGNGEAPSHFHGALYVAAAWIQNRAPWTKEVLSY